MSTIFNTLCTMRIEPPSKQYHALAQTHLNQLTKPQGALGTLEVLAMQLCAIQHTLQPNLHPIHVAVFAADHGLAKHGVSLYPQEVTAQMLLNFCQGGAAISILAKQLHAHLEVVNLGTCVPCDFVHKNFLNHPIASGSNDATQTHAMNEDELNQALLEGQNACARALKRGAKTFIGGEMGIGNSTCASALCCLLLKCDASQMTGAGTGVTGHNFEEKLQVVERIVARHKHCHSVHDILLAAGGFEIVALAGAYMACAKAGMLVLIDGFIASTAALIAYKMNPNVFDFFVFSHTSSEKGHKHLLESMHASTLLDLSMRLGEGSGAAVAAHLLECAVCLFNEMATFKDAGVSEA